MPPPPPRRPLDGAALLAQAEAAAAADGDDDDGLLDEAGVKKLVSVLDKKVCEKRRMEWLKSENRSKSITL